MSIVSIYNWGNVATEYAYSVLENQQIGSWILRKCGSDNVITYVKTQNEIRDVTVNFHRSSELVKSHPEIDSTQQFFEHLIGKGITFTIGIPRPGEDEPFPQYQVPENEKDVWRCHICCKSFPSEHKRQNHLHLIHKISYCSRKILSLITMCIKPD